MKRGSSAGSTGSGGRSGFRRRGGGSGPTGQRDAHRARAGRGRERQRAHHHAELAARDEAKPGGGDQLAALPRPHQRRAPARAGAEPARHALGADVGRAVLAARDHLRPGDRRARAVDHATGQGAAAAEANRRRVAGASGEADRLRADVAGRKGVGGPPPRRHALDAEAAAGRAGHRAGRLVRVVGDQADPGGDAGAGRLVHDAPRHDRRRSQRERHRVERPGADPIRRLRRRGAVAARGPHPEAALGQIAEDEPPGRVGLRRERRRRAEREEPDLDPGRGGAAVGDHAPHRGAARDQDARACGRGLDEADLGGEHRRALDPEAVTSGDQAAQRERTGGVGAGHGDLGRRGRRGCGRRRAVRATAAAPWFRAALRGHRLRLGDHGHAGHRLPAGVDHRAGQGQGAAAGALDDLHRGIAIARRLRAHLAGRPGRARGPLGVVLAAERERADQVDDDQPARNCDRGLASLDPPAVAGVGVHGAGRPAPGLLS